MRLKIISLIGLILAIGIFLATRQKNSDFSLSQETQSIEAQIDISRQNPTSPEKVNTAQITNEINNLKSQTDFVSNETLIAFISTQAENLNLHVEDEKALDLEYDKIANMLSEEQLNELQKTVISPKDEIKKRIVSNYLIIKNISDFSTNTLLSIITNRSEYITNRPVAVHSLAEHQQEQNKAFFNNSAEEWLKRKLQGASETKATIKKLIDNTNDENLKKFLNQKLLDG